MIPLGNSGGSQVTFTDVGFLSVTATLRGALGAGKVTSNQK